jgi:allantoinase
MSGKILFSTQCFIQEKLKPASIEIENGKICGISNQKLKGAQDFGNAVIMPGVIDAHVHINEPGHTDWEGFETATAGALAGGTTTLVDMPLNSSPVSTSLENF